jgi:hypothetical protein
LRPSGETSFKFTWFSTLENIIGHIPAVGALKDRDNELFGALKEAGELEILGFHGAVFVALLPILTRR